MYICVIHMYVVVYVCISLSLYIYIYRERERERDNHTNNDNTLYLAILGWPSDDDQRHDVVNDHADLSLLAAVDG